MLAADNFVLPNEFSAFRPWELSTLVSVYEENGQRGGGWKKNRYQIKEEKEKEVLSKTINFRTTLRCLMRSHIYIIG